VYKLPRQTLCSKTVSALCKTAVPLRLSACLPPLIHGAGESIRGGTLTQFLLKLEVHALLLYQRRLELFSKYLDAQSSMQTTFEIRASRVHTKIESLKHGLYAPSNFNTSLFSSRLAGLLVIVLNTVASSANKVRRIVSEAPQNKVINLVLRNEITCTMVLV